MQTTKEPATISIHSTAVVPCAGQMPQVFRDKDNGLQYVMTDGGHKVVVGEDKSGRVYFVDSNGNFYYDTGIPSLGFYMVMTPPPTPDIDGRATGSLIRVLGFRFWWLLGSLPCTGPLPHILSIRPSSSRVHFKLAVKRGSQVFVAESIQGHLHLPFLVPILLLGLAVPFLQTRLLPDLNRAPDKQWGSGVVPPARMPSLLQTLPCPRGEGVSCPKPPALAPPPFPPTRVPQILPPNTVVKPSSPQTPELNHSRQTQVTADNDVFNIFGDKSGERQTVYVGSMNDLQTLKIQQLGGIPVSQLRKALGKNFDGTITGFTQAAPPEEAPKMSDFVSPSDPHEMNQ